MWTLYEEHIYIYIHYWHILKVHVLTLEGLVLKYAYQEL